MLLEAIGTVLLHLLKQIPPGWLLAGFVFTGWLSSTVTPLLMMMVEHSRWLEAKRRHELGADVAIQMMQLKAAAYDAIMRAEAAEAKNEELERQRKKDLALARAITRRGE